MIETLNNSRLSSKEYWDAVLADNNLPRINRRKDYNYRVTMDFVHPYLEARKYKTFFEVGCGSSGWLPYFSKKYGFLVSGLDYSEIGCRLAEENLRLQGIKYDTIICNDFFAPNCTDNKTFDVIFSYGVIEHFEKPDQVINIFNSFLNPGGIMITLVPNLNGFIGFLSKYFVREVYDMHRVITREQIQKYHESTGLINLKTNYAGIFCLGVIPWGKSNRGLFKFGWLKSKILLRGIYIIDLLLTSVFKLIRIDIPSKTFSPYIITIAKKPE